MKRVLFWTPRILCILLAMFLCVFALDVFSEDYGLWQLIGALLLHLVPASIVVIVLVIAWRRERVGAIVFITLGLLSLVFTLGRQFNLSAYVAIPGPLILIGVLFLLNWKYRAQLRTR